jgi:hypothetical protein
MAIVTDCILPKSSVLICDFLWPEGHTAKDINKEMFPVYGGKRLSRKAVHSGVEKRSKGYADDEGIKTKVRKWLGKGKKLLVSTCW